MSHVYSLPNVIGSLYRERGHFVGVIYKFLHLQFYHKYLKDLFTLRSTTHSLRGTDIFLFCKPASTSYGLHYFKYFACKTWNFLLEKITLYSAANDP